MANNTVYSLRRRVNQNQLGDAKYDLWSRENWSETVRFFPFDNVGWLESSQIPVALSMDFLWRMSHLTVRDGPTVWGGFAKSIFSAMKDPCVTGLKGCKMLFIHHARRVPRKQMDDIDEMDEIDEVILRHNLWFLDSSAIFFQDYVPNWMQFVNCHFALLSAIQWEQKYNLL